MAGFYPSAPTLRRGRCDGFVRDSSPARPDTAERQDGVSSSVVRPDAAERQDRDSLSCLRRRPDTSEAGSRAPALRGDRAGLSAVRKCRQDGYASDSRPARPDIAVRQDGVSPSAVRPDTAARQDGDSLSALLPGTAERQDGAPFCRSLLPGIAERQDGVSCIPVDPPHCGETGRASPARLAARTRDAADERALVPQRDGRVAIESMVAPPHAEGGEAWPGAPQGDAAGAAGWPLEEAPEAGGRWRGREAVFGGGGGRVMRRG